jgi:uncharacterized protein YjbI with pentapeptide repeats
MSEGLFFLIVGWLLGIISSLLSSLVMFWLEGKRQTRAEKSKQRQDDIRTARNWASDGKKISMRGFDLQGANLSGKDLSGADLEDANLSEAIMWETNLSGANLRTANLRKIKAVSVKFINAKLLYADFTGATISDGDFTNTILHRTKLHQMKKAKGCIWKGVEIDETTEVSPEIRYEINQQNNS